MTNPISILNNKKKINKALINNNNRMLKKTTKIKMMIKTKIRKMVQIKIKIANKIPTRNRRINKKISHHKMKGNCLHSL